MLTTLKSFFTTVLTTLRYTLLLRICSAHLYPAFQYTETLNIIVALQLNVIVALQLNVIVALQLNIIGNSCTATEHNSCSACNVVVPLLLNCCCIVVALLLRYCCIINEMVPEQYDYRLFSVEKNQSCTQR